jgi:hypothetical protein
MGVTRRQRNRTWSRWLHLACGVPVEHVATLLALASDDVASFIKSATRKIPAAPPYKLPGSAIVGPRGRYVRALRDLGYTVDRTAELLALEPATVHEFLSRLKSIRGTELVRPRDRVDQQRLRANHVRAAAAEQRQARLIPKPPAGWRTVDCLTTGEAVDWKRFLETVRSGRASSAELLGQAGVFYAPPRRSAEPVVEPATWTGATNPNSGKPKLSPEMIVEMKILRSQGWSTGTLAKRYGVTRATICYALLGRTFREERPVPVPPPFSERVPIPLSP